jgi:hypothetical protein
MATTAVRDDRLVVRFSWWERLFVRRAREEVPVAATRQVEVLDHWSYQPLGARAGLIVSGLLKVGTWRSPSTARLVCMKRGLPTLRVVVDRQQSGGHFDELLVSTRDARETQAALGTGRM